MAIHYILRDNKVTADPDDYYAVAVATSSADLDDVINRMIQQGSTVSRTDIVAVLESLTTAVESMLLDGMRVNLGDLANFFARVGGKFDGPGDEFNPASGHGLDVGATAGQRLKDTVKAQATTVKETAAVPQPILLEFEDFTSTQTNTTATGNGLGALTGDNMQFDQAQADEGIYFIEQGPGTEVKVSIVAQNFPKTLMFQVPELFTSSQYALEVRARMSVGGPLRTGVLPVTLTGA